MCNLSKQTPILLVRKKPDLTFISANETWQKYAGFASADDIIGRNDEHCSWAQYAELYKRHDIDALNGNIYSVINPAKDADGRDCWFHGYKYPEFDKEGNVTSIQVVAHEITNPYWVESTNQLYNNNYYKNKHYWIGKKTEESLTKTEQKVLFLLLRGLTAKGIAMILKVSSRTVEKHVNNIKAKFNCSTKAEVIEYAVYKGYIHIIPGKNFL